MVGKPWKPIRPLGFGGRIDLPDFTDPLGSHTAASETILRQYIQRVMSRNPKSSLHAAFSAND